MKKNNQLKLSLIAVSLLFGGLAFNLATSQKEIVRTAAWSGSQTSSEGNYYSSISSETGSALKAKLKQIIGSGVSTSYDWSRYEAADEAENDSSKVLLVYARNNIAKSAHVSGSSGWNREHSYPQSKIGSPATSDNHHIFASDNKVNNTRGNKLFGVVPLVSANQVKDYTGALTDNYTTGTYFYPTALARGEVARATMYLNTLYNYNVTGNFQSTELMLEWHLENPVTNREIYRNNTVHSLQKNRNPYIDNQGWACSIYGDTNSATRQLCSTSTIEPESVVITPTGGSVNMGSTLNLNASILPSNAPQNVNWTSANNNVATVSNGLVTPVSSGEVTITATSTAKTSVNKSVVITVTNIPTAVSGVSLDKTTTTLALGSSLQLNATVNPSNASNKTVAWTSSNQNVATITPSGLLTALALGTTTITVTTSDGGFSDNFLLTVLEQPASTFIRGSFYNDTHDNNGGENGVSVQNLNHGLSSVNALGFNGKNVISDLGDVTKGYFPRSGGLALGSTNNLGTMTLILNPEFSALKVEALFNEAGKGSATVTIGGNAAIKASTGGSQGVAFSNPSDGTPYITEFNTPATEITLSTSFRIALVELVIHYAPEVTTQTPLQAATNWATSFLLLTDEGCLNQSSVELEQAWLEVTSSYELLSHEAQLIIQNTTANGNGTTLEEALARYMIIAQKYNLNPFIPNVVIPSLQRYPLINNEVIIFLVIFSLMLSVAIGSYVINWKKKL